MIPSVDELYAYNAIQSIVLPVTESVLLGQVG